MKIPRTKLRRKNRNSAISTLSNFLLATALALTGSGFIDIFSIAPRFYLIADITFIALGCVTLSAACAIHLAKESEDDDNDPDHNGQ